MSSRLTIRLSVAEKGAMERAAASKKTTVSAYARERLIADSAATTFAREMTDSVVRVVSTEAEKSTAAVELVRTEITALRSDLAEQIGSVVRQVWAAAKKAQKDEA